MPTKKRKEVKVFALGGLGEVGKNMYCVEYGNELIVIDAGVKFPPDDLLGVDYVIPEYTYLKENIHKIKALFITHGHEDHIGGLPFLLKQVNIPVIYSPKLAASLIRNKLSDRGVNYKNIKELNEELTVKFKYLSVEFFRTNHSIPDSYGLAIKSPEGTIIHTGDFKFDFTPIGEPASIGKMATYGEKGVLCLLSDSTNAEVESFTRSESIVDKALGNIFAKIDGRIIIATFASNVHRLKHIVETSIEQNRKIAVFGRSMENAISAALELGYVKAPKGTFIESRDVNKYNQSEIVIMCTGSQGEPLAALSRISQGTHRQISLIPGDTVIFSSSPIPGNAQSIGKTINRLHEHGAKVITNALESVHASGHGGQLELKLMLSLIKPKYFMPIHGEFRMQKIHGDLGIATGVKKENVFVMKNGDVLALTRDSARRTKSIPADDIYVDGNRIGEIGNIVIRDRRILSSDGILIVSASIDMKNKKLLEKPAITSRGFIHVNKNEAFVKELVGIASFAIERKLGTKRSGFNDIKGEITDVLIPFIYEKTQRKPMILPVIMDVKR